MSLLIRVNLALTRPLHRPVCQAPGEAHGGAAESTEALIGQLAEEIDSPAERRAFIATCQQSLRTR